VSFAPLASGSRPVTRTLLLFREVGGSFMLHRLCCGRQHTRPRTIAALSAAHSTRARVDAPSCGCARRRRCGRAAGTGTARRRRGSARYGGVSRLRPGNTRNLPVHLLACHLIWPGRLKVCRYCQVPSRRPGWKWYPRDSVDPIWRPSYNEKIIPSPGSAHVHSHEYHKFNPVSDSRDFWDV
jgi:hypothetical protein